MPEFEPETADEGRPPSERFGPSHLTLSRLVHLSLHLRSFRTIGLATIKNVRRRKKLELNTANTQDERRKCQRWEANYAERKSRKQRREEVRQNEGFKLRKEAAEKRRQEQLERNTQEKAVAKEQRRVRIQNARNARENARKEAEGKEGRETETMRWRENREN